MIYILPCDILGAMVLLDAWLPVLLRRGRGDEEEGEGQDLCQRHQARRECQN